MASNIEILVVGYANSLDGQQHGDSEQAKYMAATGSCCLVYSSNKKILFDTMGPWERDKLIQRLEQLKVHPDDIDILVCSHSHPDHIGNLNLFTKAKKHFVGTSVYSRDIYDLNNFEPIGSYTYKSLRGLQTEVIKYRDHPLDANLSIEPTPGHTMECVSLIVKNCDNFGTVALAGDLFENHGDVTNESIWLAAGSQNSDLQRASRARIYNKVDYILPGHGPIFKTDQKPLTF